MFKNNKTNVKANEYKGCFQSRFFSPATRGRRGHKGGNSNVVINWFKHYYFTKCYKAE